MTQENLNIIILHNICSMKEENGIRVYYSFPQDIEIIKTIKKLPYEISSMFYEEDKIKLLKKDCLVVNLCDAFSDPEDEIKLIQNLEKNSIPYTGCSSYTTKLCQDKFILKKILEKNNIKCPKGRLFKNAEEKLWLPPSPLPLNGLKRIVFIALTLFFSFFSTVLKSASVLWRKFSKSLIFL